MRWRFRRTESISVPDLSRRRPWDEPWEFHSEQLVFTCARRYGLNDETHEPYRVSTKGNMEC